MLKHYQNIISVDGYEWRNDIAQVDGLSGYGAKGESPFLWPVGNKRRISYPLEDFPTIFEIFANLKEGPEAELQGRIIKFANEHGLLGIKTFLDGIPWFRGEGLNLWREEISDLYLAYKLWKCLDRNWIPSLSLYIHWDNNRVGLTWEEVNRFTTFMDLFWVIEKGQYIKHEIVTNGSEVVFSQGDVIGPAKYFLQQLINQKLNSHVSPMVIRDQEYNLHPYFVPDSLLATIWFQLFQAATGIKNFVQCEICGGLIALNEKSRKSKKVHSNCSKAKWKREYDAGKKGAAKDE